MFGTCTLLIVASGLYILMANSCTGEDRCCGFAIVGTIAGHWLRGTIRSSLAPRRAGIGAAKMLASGRRNARCFVWQEREFRLRMRNPAFSTQEDAP